MASIPAWFTDLDEAMGERICGASMRSAVSGGLVSAGSAACSDRRAKSEDGADAGAAVVAGLVSHDLWGGTDTPVLAKVLELPACCSKPVDACDADCTAAEFADVPESRVLPVKMRWGAE